jgi:hypothetical protein
VARVPIWVPWPPPPGWLVAGFAGAGDDNSGASAVVVALSGPDPLGGGPADLVLVAEEPGTGLGASFAGLPGPDPGPGFDRSAPVAKVQVGGHPVPMWAAGGVPVLAHPRAWRRGYGLTDDEIAGLAAAGLAGIEADHPDHAGDDRARLRDVAAELGMFVTGASDDHGELTGHRLGAETTSPEAYEALVAEATGAAPDQGVRR